MIGKLTDKQIKKGREILRKMYEEAIFEIRNGNSNLYKQKSGHVETILKSFNEIVEIYPDEHIEEHAAGITRILTDDEKLDNSKFGKIASNMIEFLYRDYK